MPTYDYVCDACDHKFEQFQSMKEDALTKCPKCKKKIGAETLMAFPPEPAEAAK